MASKLDGLIAHVAIEAANRDLSKVVAAARETAPQLKATDVAKLSERWYPKVSAKAAGAPELSDSWPRLWFAAITEILCHRGTDGLPVLLELLARDRATYHEFVVLRLLRIAAAVSERDLILNTLRERIPMLHTTEVSASVREIVFWSEFDQQPLDTLRSFSKLKAKGDELTVGDYLEQCELELAHAQAERGRDSQTLGQGPPHRQFAEAFATAVIAGNQNGAQGMLCTELQSQFSSRQLGNYLAEYTEHSGWPESFAYKDNETTAAALRESSSEFPPLPDHVTDQNFRRWCCIQFLPDSESDADVCFDLWMAIIEERGEHKVGFFHALDAD